MTIRGLFNHRAVAYGGVPVRDEFGDTRSSLNITPDGTPDGNNARPNQNWSGSLQDHGPGEQQNAKRQWFLHRDFLIEEGDVLDVVSGPEAPIRLRVESISRPARARGGAHHIEVHVDVWPTAPEDS